MTENALPPHEGGAAAPVAARIIATWPEGSFVENIAIDQAGAIFVTVHPAGEIRRVDPDGSERLFATLPTPIAGLAFAAGGALFVSGGTPGKPGGVIWRVLPDATFERWLDIPDALFLNGITPGPGDSMLVVDSILGRVFRVATDRPNLSVWLQDERLTPAPGVTGLPGVNGIKRFQGAYTLTNTTRAILLRASVGADGAAGPLALAAEHLRGDDFAFGAGGEMFVATHMHNTLVRLLPDGTRSTIAGPDEGMVSATACAFGRGAGDRNALYVTTTGGVAAPYQGALQKAKLVRLEVGVGGAALL
jgi:sugar lactone lactonase YvrE